MLSNVFVLSKFSNQLLQDTSIPYDERANLHSNHCFQPEHDTPHQQEEHLFQIPAKIFSYFSRLPSANHIPYMVL